MLFVVVGDDVVVGVAYVELPMTLPIPLTVEVVAWIEPPVAANATDELEAAY